MKWSILTFLVILFYSFSYSASETDPIVDDRIEVVGGAVLLGQIETIEAGSIQLQTEYAGLLTVDIEKIERLDLGRQRDIGLPLELVTRYTQPETTSPASTPAKGSTAAPAVNAGAASKTTVATEELPTGWNMEAGFDLNGKTGNTQRLDLSVNVEAELERQFDRTNLYGRYAYGENRGTRSANEIIGGGKYTNFFLDRTGIFVRGELEQDDFEGILVRSTSAVGFTYQFRNRKDLRIEARTGVSHRYEDYIDDGEENFPGMDLGLDISWNFVEWARFKGTYTLLPSVSNFNDFIFEQDTGFNLPIATGYYWKLRFGVTSQYNNEPDVGREKLDTRYYARLIATWF